MKPLPIQNILANLNKIDKIQDPFLLFYTVLNGMHLTLLSLK